MAFTLLSGSFCHKAGHPPKPGQSDTLHMQVSSNQLFSCVGSPAYENVRFHRVSSPLPGRSATRSAGELVFTLIVCVINFFKQSVCLSHYFEHTVSIVFIVG